MKSHRLSDVISTGLAMFSMFFGAGNVVFPLALGLRAGDQNIYAISGLLITAVGVPFLGLVSMLLFDGNFHQFFGRVGTYVGMGFMVMIMSLIGPFVGIPRCVALSHATLKLYVPGVSLFMFSLAACVLIYVLTVRKSRILDLLGYVLAPLLLLSLFVLIVRGLWAHPPAMPMQTSVLSTFLSSLTEGYKTLDLFAAFFFSSVVLVSLKRRGGDLGGAGHIRGRAIFMLKASGIGAALLAFVYTGFSFVASYYARTVGVVPDDELLGVLSSHILGGSAGFIGNAAVALACLTTAITLAAVFADFTHNELLVGRGDYRLSLLVTMIVTFAMANLGFSGLMTLMAPVWFITYPALIVLSIANIAYKLTGFTPVRGPVLATLALSTVHFLLF